MPDDSFDVLIASRLFTVLPNRRRAVAEMYRVLRPGGRCFIAEPRYAFWASIPLLPCGLLAGLTQFQERLSRAEPREGAFRTRNESALRLSAVAENGDVGGRALSIRPL